MLPEASYCEAPPPLPILNAAVTPFASRAHAIRCISARVLGGGRAFCVAINAAKLYYARHRAEMARALASADYWLCDGVGAVMAARLLRGVTIRRCTDGFLEELMSEARRNEWKVFLLGATPESNQGAADALRRQYPGLQVVGRRDGYFEDSEDVVRRVNESRAQVLVVGMGSPRQEVWVAQHLDRLQPPCIVTVGGALDVLSGRVKRAPRLFRRTGTEFLYRLFAEPGRKRWARHLEACAAGIDILKECARVRWLGHPEANETDRRDPPR
jgi:N-acetylglucosaminyldiphosphoundecaprenol N-acetyl-beta-D-mannosaminyltransferase